MSTFKVTVESIKSLHPIPDADAIEVARLDGMDFQFVVRKGAYAPGDRVLYFPVDSLLPDGLIERLGLTNKLSGPEKNRIKTATFRGAISQGLVGPLDLIPEGVSHDELTTALGVTKYDPPMVELPDATLVGLFNGISAYDIESADRYPALVEAQLMDVPVVVTEKLEGNNLWVWSDGDVTRLGQRNYQVVQKDGVRPNLFAAVADQSKLTGFAAFLARKYGKPATVYSELIGDGICKNLYGLKGKTARIFDVRVYPRWLDHGELVECATEFFGHNPPLAPVLSPGDKTLREWLGGRTVKEASDGVSMLAKRAREGVVIRPTTERRDPQLGRLIIKQRGPKYLAKTDL